MGRKITDHKGDPVELNDHTVYHGYAYRVECPHCGAAEGDPCLEMTRFGPAGGQLRSPHQERAELAREVFGEGVTV